jgi:hypothetical protein
LKKSSHIDAFSGYTILTWLPSNAFDKTADTL